MNLRLFSIVGLVVAMAMPRLVSAEQAFSSIDFQYDRDKLYINVHVKESGYLHVRYTEVGLTGRPRGRTKKKRFQVESGNNDLLLDVGKQRGHQIRLKLNKTVVNLFANRGVWFSTPRDGHVAGSRVNARFSAFNHLDDMMIAAGFHVSIGLRSESSTRIAVERTLGGDNGYGIALDRKQRVLVLVAKGTGGPVKVTLSQRLNKTTVQYWDFDMILEKSKKRYEIPLKKFRCRKMSAQPLTSIHTVSVSPSHPVNAGDRIAVDFLGLSSGGLFISSIKSGRDSGAVVQLEGKLKYPSLLYYRDKQSNENTLRVHTNRIHLPDTAEAVWVCYDNHRLTRHTQAKDEKQKLSICDPPDAPLSTYGVTSQRDVSLVVDRFDTLNPVNAFRLPAVVFGSSSEVKEQTTVERFGDELRLTYYPQSVADYAGYLTYLPKSVANGYETLAVTLRGSIPPNLILIGVKDTHGREARIPIISYWRGDETAANPLYDLEDVNTNNKNKHRYADEGFRTVFIPLAAFRAVFYNVFKGHAILKDISAVSITMISGGKEIFHEIELKRIEFLRDTSPISVTAFDGDQYGINALGGVNFSEDDKGGLIDVRLNADGYYGKGLRVQVFLARDDSYGLVAMGFGKLDVSNYDTLSFFVRGENGREDGFIFLNDGKKRVSVRLKDHIGVSNMWRKVDIPLGVFREKGVNLHRLSQIILAWEEEQFLDHTIYFDNFVFE